MIVFRYRDFRMSLKLNKVIRVEPGADTISVLIKRDARELVHSLHAPAPRKSHVNTQSSARWKESSHHKPDFPASRTVRFKNFSC